MAGAKTHKFRHQRSSMAEEHETKIALKYHENGQYDLAKKIYQKLISQNKQNTMVLYLNGTLLYQLEHFDAAIKDLSRAIALNPNFSQALNNRGNTYMAIGKINKAICDYESAIDKDPNNFKAINNKAEALLKARRTTDALNCLNNSIKIAPNQAHSYLKRAKIYSKMQENFLAIDDCNHAIRLNRNFLDAYLERGLINYKIGHFTAAIKDFDKTISHNSTSIAALNNRGLAFKAVGRFKDALLDFDNVILLEPDHVEALNNRGVVLKTMRRFDEALKDLDKAISLSQKSYDIINNRGATLWESGFFEEAISDYNKAISLNPDHAEAYNNRGNALKEMMRLDESLEDFNKAIALKPDYVDAHWNKSTHSLLLEDFQAGWPMYEWRLQREEWVVGSALKTNKPRWDGQRDKTVFLWAEQGVGDEIMFASLIPELQAISSSVIVQCDERLITLFKRSFTGPITYYANRSEVPQESYDFHLPIASLPLFFRFSRDDYKKASNPYLRCEKPEADLIRQKILDNKTNTLIGVSWKSSSKLPGAQHRNIELGSLAQKLTSPEVTLVNLQYGDVSEEIRALKESYNIEILEVPEIDKYNDIDGLASLITACHEVVSIDNATVHLAGALGAKTKALLPFNQDWRWGISHTGSYWYNSVKLLRQKRLGDWTETLSQI